MFFTMTHKTQHYQILFVVIKRVFVFMVNLKTIFISTLFTGDNTKFPKQSHRFLSGNSSRKIFKPLLINLSGIFTVVKSFISSSSLFSTSNRAKPIGSTCRSKFTRTYPALSVLKSKFVHFSPFMNQHVYYYTDLHLNSQL